MTAAVVVHCATMENPRAYWPVRSAVFRTQERWATSISALERISVIASRAGNVEASKLRSCVEDRGDELSRRILRTAEAAREAGVMATPTLPIDGEAVTSGKLEETLRDILDGPQVDE